MTDETQANDAPFVVSIDVRPGTLFHGRYLIEGLLGRGGMGTVYRAHDRRLDETVAIKVLRPDFAADPKMAERFRSEIKLARKVRHKNVCTIHDYGEDRGLLYISMELIEGVDLKFRLKAEGALPAEEAYSVAMQIAQGLQAVHDAGIVHRDLKSPNIMIDAAGTARLMDFGIAKRVGDGTATATGQIVGTPEYMSPEQAQGHKVDHRSDLYALGIVIYEIFTGQVPFRGETPISTILKHLNEPPQLEVAALPHTLRLVLKRCLAKDPGQRYGSAAEIAEALRQARSPSLRQQPVATDVLQAPTQVMGRIGGGPRVSWLVLGVAAVLALSLALGLGAWLRGRQATRASVSPEPVAQSSLAPRERSTAPPETTLLAAPPTAAPVIAMSVPSPQSASPERRPLSPRPTPRPQATAMSFPTPTNPPAADAARAAADSARAAAGSARAAAEPEPTRTAPIEPGQLQIAVKPWGEVSVNGRVLGTTPLDRISLPAGAHRIRVRHPGFPPWEGSITVHPGETAKLLVDLPKEAARR